MSTRWTVAQIGAREHYGVAVALHRRGRLRTLFTDIWWAHGAIPSFMPAKLRALAARRHHELVTANVRSFSRTLLWRELTQPRGRSRRNRYDEFIETGEWFGRRVRGELERMKFRPDQDRFF